MKFKNRTIVGIGCIILSLVVMFGISPLINKIAAEKQTVYQVKEMIEQGQVITKDDVTKVEIGAYGVKKGMITDSKDVVGKYAKSDIYPNINIYPSMLTDKANSADDVFSTLNGENLAMSLTIPNLASGLSGKLQNGDIVSVVMTDGTGSTIPKQLTYVKVITTTTSAGADNTDVVKDENGNTQLPSTVTVLVNKDQATLLANFEQNAKIHLALVYRGDEETANQFLDAQQKALTEVSNTITELEDNADE